MPKKFQSDEKETFLSTLKRIQQKMTQIFYEKSHSIFGPKILRKVLFVEAIYHQKYSPKVAFHDPQLQSTKRFNVLPVLLGL